jgi:hypothetical protein
MIQHDINNLTNNLCDWVRRNHLRLNIDKTKAVIFKAMNKQLDGEISIVMGSRRVVIVDSIKFLGVIFQSTLQWNKHVQSVVSKLRRVVGIVSNIRHCLTPQAKMHVYNCLFYSYVHYSSIQVLFKYSRASCRAPPKK